MKQLTPILQHKTETVGHEPCAHAAVVRLNQRHHHAVGIRNGQIRGVAPPSSLGSPGPNTEVARAGSIKANRSLP